MISSNIVTTDIRPWHYGIAADQTTILKPECFQSLSIHSAALICRYTKRSYLVNPPSIIRICQWWWNLANSPKDWNFALLAGIHPDELDCWYLGVYIDAFVWVDPARGADTSSPCATGKEPFR